MATRGRKPDLPTAKRARGTSRPDRDLHEAVPTPSSPLELRAPELSYGAAIVWEEYAAAAAAHGARQCDADSFAEWCVMTANLRQARVLKDGALPPSAYVQQWRTLGELFGLAGPKSRVHVKGGGSVEANPFHKFLDRPKQP